MLPAIYVLNINGLRSHHIPLTPVSMLKTCYHDVDGDSWNVLFVDGTPYPLIQARRTILQPHLKARVDQAHNAVHDAIATLRRAAYREQAETQGLTRAPLVVAPIEGAPWTCCICHRDVFAPSVARPDRCVRCVKPSLVVAR